MSHDHRVRRPAWVCAVDGYPWPCAPARAALVGAFPDQVVLTCLAARWMAQAAADLAVAGPTALYGRFVAWALHPAEACRVCGSPRHRARAGLPPRLTPCLVQRVVAASRRSGEERG